MSDENEVRCARCGKATSRPPWRELSPATVHSLEQRWRDPLQADLDDPLFEAIWQAIRTWDVNVPEQYAGYCGANGNHAVAILDKVREVQQKRITTLEQAVGELVEGLRPFAAAAGNEIRLTTDNTEQIFYNFLPTGHCRHAAALIQKHGGLV